MDSNALEGALPAAPPATLLRDQHERQPLFKVLPPLILGTAAFNTQFNKDPYALDTAGLISQALSFGIRAFDTSPYYGPAEELLGAGLSTPEVLSKYSRKDYFLLSKVGRIAEHEFDYSPEWIRHSISRSLERLHTKYLDVVYCHDVEFVSEEEAIVAVKELRRIRDEDATIKYVGISGYPLDVLCRIASRVLAETGEPLDAVMSYAHFTLQNTTLETAAMATLKAAGVEVVPNASPLGMGLLRRAGPPIGLTDFHPAGQNLRNAIKEASDFCDTHDEKLEVIGLRYSIETWTKTGSQVGTLGDPASGLPWKRETIEQLGGQRLGVSVFGISSTPELQKIMRIWRSILDGMENGQEMANAAGRWKRGHEWSLNRQQGVRMLAEEIQDILGDWYNYDWPSPPPGYVNAQKAVPWPSPSPSPDLQRTKDAGGTTIADAITLSLRSR